MHAKATGADGSRRNRDARVVFALGFAAYGLATAVAQEVVSVVQQKTFDEQTGAGGFDFTVFDTKISYVRPPALHRRRA